MRLSSTNLKPTGREQASPAASAGNGVRPARRSAIPCSEITTLRELGSKLTFVINKRTGDELEYIVIGDGADSDEVLVMFPGRARRWPTGRYKC